MATGKRVLLRAALALVISGGIASAVSAQQTTISTPNHNVSDSFFERTGVHWGLNWDGGFFRFGGPNMATPPVGNFDPAAGANLGVGFRGNGVDGFAHFNAAQGSRRTFTSQTPSITLPNGGTGFFSDTSQSPFVISYIPVVGGFPTVGALAPVVPPAMPGTPGGHTPVARYRRMLKAQAAQQRQQRQFPDLRRQEVLVRDPQPAPAEAEAKPAPQPPRDFGNRGGAPPDRPAPKRSGTDLNAPLILIGPGADDS
jgi:hypothetical protein